VRKPENRHRAGGSPAVSRTLGANRRDRARAPVSLRPSGLDASAGNPRPACAAATSCRRRRGNRGNDPSLRRSAVYGRPDAKWCPGAPPPCHAVLRVSSLERRQDGGFPSWRDRDSTCRARSSTVAAFDFKSDEDLMQWAGIRLGQMEPAGSAGNSEPSSCQPSTRRLASRPAAYQSEKESES